MVPTHGSTWTAPHTANDSVDVVQALPNGKIAIGGDFKLVDGVGSAHFARLASSCPATSVPFGKGCGTPLPNELTTTSLPWIGGTLTSEGTGGTNNAIAIAVSGLAAVTQPLAPILPTALPGCDLLVTADFLDLALFVNGIARSDLVIPPAVSLVGAVFHQQFVTIELLPAGFGPVTSSNGLTHTIGQF